jgi:hypothetical protein
MIIIKLKDISDHTEFELGQLFEVQAVNRLEGTVSAEDDRDKFLTKIGVIEPPDGHSEKLFADALERERNK